MSLLADIGRQNTVMGRNAVSLCNLLFLGSLISLVPMVFMFWKDWTRDNLGKLSRKDWGVLTLSAFLSSALTPALFFIALDYTTVTNVVLIGRIEPPLFLLATVFVLKEKLDPWAFAAGLIALVGAVIIISLKGGEAAFTFGKGEIATVFATLSFIASTLVTRIGLKGVPLGIFSIYRTVLGTIIYYFLALYLYGPHHFQDLFPAHRAEICLGLRDHRHHHRPVLVEPRPETCPLGRCLAGDFLFTAGRAGDRDDPAG